MELPLLFEKHLSTPINPLLTAYCDQHDLIAVVTKTSRDQQEEVVVYRINGEIAFRIPAKIDEDEVTVLKWKSDGRLLGIGWKKLGCGVHDGETGKLLSSSEVVEKEGDADDWKLDLSPDFGGDEDDEGVEVTCIGWAEHLPPHSRKRRKLFHADADFGFTAEDSASDGRDLSDQISSASALADSIAKLDVTSVLPRLSALPAHGLRSGPDSSKFAAQMSIDGIFKTKDESSDSIDTLITAGSTGFANVLLNDSVMIGNYNFRHRIPKMHSSHPLCASQVIISGVGDTRNVSNITRSSPGDNDSTSAPCLHFIDLPMEKLGGSLMDIVATNTKRIQNLIEYIVQTVRCIQNDYHSNLQLPRRLMNSISSELSEKDEGDIVLNLYHLALTGSFTPTMLEWLRDIVKETNHKRWDQSINNLYTHVLDHLFANLVPALDRLSIAASTLRGHAKLHEGSSDFVPSHIFTALLDDVEALKLVVQKMQLVVVAEHRQFRAFSKWMRTMIEISVAGPGSKGAIETEDRDMPNLDYNLILAYIRDTMSKSKLSVHLEDTLDLKGRCSQAAFFNNTIIAGMNREITIEAVKGLERSTYDSELVETPAQINLQALTVRLTGQARYAMEFITTRWQSQMLPILPKSIPILMPTREEARQVILDAKLFPHRGEQYENVTHILFKADRSSKLHVQQVFQGRNPTEVLTVDKDVPAYDGLVQDAKIIDDAYIAVLICESDTHQVVISGPTDSESGPKKLGEYGFSPGFKPRSFIVGGREGKTVCVVFDEAGLNWKVLSLSEVVKLQKTRGR